MLWAKPFLRWRGRPVIAFCLAVFLCLGAASARSASFTASLDRDTIALGEQATLSLTFDGGQPTKLTSLNVPGLQFGNPSRSFSQNIDFNSGQVNAKLTLTYSVLPQREGEFTIPALIAEVNGQQLSTAPLKLVVTKPGALNAAAVNSGNEAAFMRLVLPQQKVYPGEVLAAQLQIYLRDDVGDNSQPRFTSTPADGLILGKSANGNASQVQIGNRTYTVYPIIVALTATKAGTLTLGPFTANMVVVLPSSDDQLDPMLRQQQQMLRQMGIRSPLIDGERKQVFLATEQATVQSLPLPKDGKPAGFNGAIGHFTMTATAGPTNVAVGDPITLHIQISGRGALDSLALPDQPAWQNFKVYPPTSKVEASDQLGLEGSKTFEEIVSPENTDVRQLPQFSFSFFDPDDGNYHTLTQPPVQLAVRSTGMAAVPAVAAANAAGAQNPSSPQDILPIKEDLGALVPASAPLVTRPAFLALQSLPVLALLAAFVWRKRTDSLANNPRLRRQRAVAQIIASGMDDLKKYAAANQPDEFFATLFRLLQEQLGERLDCPASAITEAVIEERLVPLAAPEPVVDGLRELFQLCNQARYAPIRGTSELNSVAAQFENVIGELKKLKV